MVLISSRIGIRVEPIVNVRLAPCSLPWALSRAKVAETVLYKTSASVRKVLVHSGLYRGNHLACLVEPCTERHSRSVLPGLFISLPRYGDASG